MRISCSIPGPTSRAKICTSTWIRRPNSPQVVTWKNRISKKQSIKLKRLCKGLTRYQIPTRFNSTVFFFFYFRLSFYWYCLFSQQIPLDQSNTTINSTISSTLDASAIGTNSTKIDESIMKQEAEEGENEEIADIDATEINDTAEVSAIEAEVSTIAMALFVGVGRLIKILRSGLWLGCKRNGKTRTIKYQSRTRSVFNASG